MKEGSSKQVIAAVVAIVASIGPLAADKLDALVKKEQANVDNEAVVVYGGKVGKLDAIFHIEWAGTGSPVDGWYYYPTRGKGTRYILKGNNPKEGVLNLQEYSVNDKGKRKLTATCRLTKRLTNKRVIWEGKMNNTDGRVLDMSFSRPR